ncbi:cytochrome ubiquinol oxidase subunit I [Tessaracoccus sp. MC1865]|uniref:cytochrome ubiquinol oxidase subunit I n=1 Tax=unclassified Tessaracoccus TaxID=2635419 RepID=UPI00160285D5|nr:MULTISPECIES: cytochrome ubiquinol oxidase subunit I [unclassified Tessaracoccus]MBB1483273.1 cytochrome ubiquinol oxidase subunit I [Tessaracoccus sp. MC1865]MBB1510295.1 cytochrome ubiquinol oxidase subunit I [Tessaracoccus sp. MC1756]QTO37316.1 cytochrome ubiquinol oxidase subunit I [Tessaracoccus sp. MC1865]
MDPVILARWQFGITTVYHYLFVPITIAMSMLVAVLQTFWVRTGKDAYLRLTKFFGKLFLINFALGVVTGIVQEFQFGMNWSEYSRFVGDVFGAPLALEALLAFFLESTFLGLWIFGWDKLPKWLHLMAIYMAAFGTMLSAVFILAANSWMQHPVGTIFTNGRAELDGVDGFLEVLSNPVFLVTFPHVIFGAYMVAGGLLAAIGGWHLAKLNRDGEAKPGDTQAYRFATKFGAWVLLVASVGVIFTGDLQSKIMTEVQPMKMAAAEGLFYTEENASFSIVTIGNLEGTEEVFAIKIPGLLSTLSGHETVKGINNLRDEYAANGFQRFDETKTTLQTQYAAELQANYEVDPMPNVAVSYWTFRLMIGLGFIGIAIAAFTLWSVRKDRLPKYSRFWTVFMFAMPLLPLFANSFGWIFTEMGRQPWLVAGVLPTQAGVSASVSAGEVLFSMIVFTLLYGGLAVLEVWLFLKYAKAGLPEVAPVEVQTDADAPMSFAY